MSFPDFEESRARSAPVELYLFEYGPNASARIALCDGDRAVVFDGIEYIPSPLKRGKITSSQSLDKSEFKVMTGMGSPVAELFRVFAPSYPVGLTIRSGHYGDPDNDFVVVFVGRVTQSRRAASSARDVELSCVSDSIAIRRPGLRRHYQLTCPHVLYDQAPFSCRASKAAATQIGRVVQSVTSAEVSLAPGWNGAVAAAKYVGGMIEWAGANGPEKRSILRVNGNALRLNAPPTGLTVGALVDVALGCNHQVSDCTTLHNNVLNFGGMPFIPGVNPVKSNPFN